MKLLLQPATALQAGWMGFFVLNFSLGNPYYLFSLTLAICIGGFLLQWRQSISVVNLEIKSNSGKASIEIGSLV